MNSQAISQFLKLPQPIVLIARIDLKLYTESMSAKHDILKMIRDNPDLIESESETKSLIVPNNNGFVNDQLVSNYLDQSVSDTQTLTSEESETETLTSEESDITDDDTWFNHMIHEWEE